MDQKSYHSVWHVTDRTSLDIGSRIEPGHWGRTVLALGQRHPHFYRELLLELWRREKSRIKVSRLDCVFVFDDLSSAQTWRSENQKIYRVEPADSNTPRHRADWLWLTWMGELGSSYHRALGQCGAYWAGSPTVTRMPQANAVWELLIGGAVQILDRVES